MKHVFLQKLSMSLFSFYTSVLSLDHGLQIYYKKKSQQQTILNLEFPIGFVILKYTDFYFYTPLLAYRRLLHGHWLNETFQPNVTAYSFSTIPMSNVVMFILWYILSQP
jgi:hypothetical protein